MRALLIAVVVVVVGTSGTAEARRAPADARPSQPVVIAPTPAAPVAVPMRADNSVEGPKLLR